MNWRQQWLIFLDTLYLTYLPERHKISCPPIKKDRKATDRTKMGPDMEAVKDTGKIYRRQPGTFEYDLVQNALEARDPRLTDRDKELLEAEGLSELVAAKVKPLWAKEYSAQRAANVFKGIRGYSDRTLDKYWKIFNKAQQKG